VLNGRYGLRVGLTLAVVLVMATGGGTAVASKKTKAWRSDPTIAAKILNKARDGEVQKKSVNVSGLACGHHDGGSVCIAVSDESRAASIVRLDQKKAGKKGGGKSRIIGKDRFIDLLPFDPRPEAEADFEAVAALGGYFYVVGSHSRRRKAPGAAQPRRKSIVRFRIAAAVAFARKQTAVVRIEAMPTGRLWSILRHAKWQGRSARARLLSSAAGDGAQNRINIEGAAAFGGRLWLGFRQPVTSADAVHEETAYVLSLAPEQLFGAGAGDDAAEAYGISIGGGIRSMAAIEEEGFLILSGPPAGKRKTKAAKRAAAADRAAGVSTRRKGAFALHFWKPGAPAVAIRTLPRPRGRDRKGKKAKGKPEVIHLLEWSAETRTARVLILSDGVQGGEPYEVSVRVPE